MAQCKTGLGGTGFLLPTAARAPLQDSPWLCLPLPFACWAARSSLSSQGGGTSTDPVLIWLPLPQSYGPEHLLTFHNLKRIGLLTEQAAGETLTAVESRVSKLVTDRAAGESGCSHVAVVGAVAQSMAPVLALPAGAAGLPAPLSALLPAALCVSPHRF